MCYLEKYCYHTIMLKGNTTKAQYEQINLSLEYIYYHCGEVLSAKSLAKISGYSVYHFHRVFKAITSESVSQYIRNIRLEKSSNLLLYNIDKSIEIIAYEVGFLSSSAFSSAFKKRFSMTPSNWRVEKHEEKSVHQKIDSLFKIKEPEIVYKPQLPITYLRIHGYRKEIENTWIRLDKWVKEQKNLKKEYKYIGVFHNYPSSLPHEECRYLASIHTDEKISKGGEFGTCIMEDGMFAKFGFFCTHDELYDLMKHAYQSWPSKSKYKIRNFPAYAQYSDLENILTTNKQDIDFFIPLQLKNVMSI